MWVPHQPLHCVTQGLKRSHLNSVSKKLEKYWHCNFSMNILANSYFIFQISHAKTFKRDILGACTIILFKNIHKNA